MLALGSLLILGTATVSLAADPVPVIGARGAWQFEPNHSDEFDGTELDSRKWNADMKDWGRWSWDPANVAVLDGTLRLQMAHVPHVRDGEQLMYTSGAVVTRTSPILYAYVEARVRAAPRYPGVSTAFWAFRNTPELWTEIDVVELTQHWSDPSIGYFNTHVVRHPALPDAQPLHEQRTALLPGHPADDFHIYSVEWSANELIWYVDGKVVARRHNELWHQPLDVVLSVGLRPPLNRLPQTTGFPTIAQVDYVRAWSLSQSGD